MGNYAFEDDLKTIAMVGGANPHESEQEMVSAVIKKAQEHDIPLTPEHVTLVQRIGTPGVMAVVHISAQYSVPVNLPG